MKFNIATRVGGSYLVLTLFVIITGLAGTYAVSRLVKTLDYITNEAWDTAQGAMETSLAISQQLLAVQEIVKETQGTDRLGGVQQNVKSNAEVVLEARARLNSAVEMGAHAVEKMAASGLIKGEEEEKLSVTLAEYTAVRDSMLDALDRFVTFDTDLRIGVGSFQELLDRLSAIGQQPSLELGKNGSRQITWNGGLEEKWQSALLTVEAQNAFLRRIQYYNLYVSEVIAKATANSVLNSSLESMREKITTLSTLKLFRDVRLIEDEEGDSIDTSALLKQMGVSGNVMSITDGALDEIDIHDVEFKTAIAAYDAYRAEDDRYQAVAVDLLSVLKNIEKVGAAAVEGQADAINATVNRSYITILMVLLVSVVVAVVFGVVVVRIMKGVFARIIEVAEGVTKGELETVDVSEAEAGNEVGELLLAMKKMVDKLGDENRQLNDSIIDLLEATAQLSERDLTVQVPVANDITGPVSDAVKVLAYETAKVLKEIRDVSEMVEEASNTVRDQGNKVAAASAKDRDMTFGAIATLTGLAEGVGKLAGLAETCDEMARRTSASTADALQQVLNTSKGMNDIRETISETEKRIKRLGERSQEISSVVEIINNVAERTHILALNASMQAAAAGDAGRGFAVVADEVQRLAESSRQSTSEIAALVSNIQSETAETMAAMNKAIGQVVDGTATAKKSGEQMEATVRTTQELSGVIGEIATSARAQSDTLETVAGQATQVTETLTKTGEELEEQATVIEKLLAFARQMTASVRQFKLPS